jgi:hypothetical protein
MGAPFVKPGKNGKQPTAYTVYSTATKKKRVKPHSAPLYPIHDPDLDVTSTACLDRASLPPLVDERMHRPHTVDRRAIELKYDYELKVLLVGESGCGKNSVINRYVNGHFNDTKDYYTNYGNRSKIIKYKGWNVKLQISNFRMFFFTSLASNL